MPSLFFNIYLKFFFLLTPFFLLSTFLSMTRDTEAGERKKIALKVTLSIVMISIILLLIGNQIFYIFGITINSFRIGTGVLLFLSAITLVQGSDRLPQKDMSEHISVVPLAIPVAVGPATTGALLVMGVDLPGTWEKIIGGGALIAAILSVGLLLYLGGSIERIVKRQGLIILSKITGLILAALAAQMVMAGTLGFLGR